MANFKLRNENPSFLSEAKRIGSGAGISALKGLESLIIGVPTALGMPEPMAGRPSQAIEQIAGLTPEYLEPQNFPEMALQKFAKYAPLSGFSGALSNTAGLVRSGLGALAGGAAQYADLPEWAQDLAQLGTEVGTGVAQKAYGIRGAQKAADTAARESVIPGSRSAAGVPTFKKTIYDLENKLRLEPDKALTGKIRHAYNTTLRTLEGGKANPVELMDLRKNLYRTAQKFDKSVAAQYFEPLTKGINNVFAQYSAENPNFYRHLTERDKLTALKNMQPVIGDFISDLTSWFKPAQLLASPIKAIFDEGERFLRGMVSNSAARKLYLNTAKAAFNQNPTLFFNNANKLIDAVAKKEDDRFTFRKK